MAMYDVYAPSLEETEKTFNAAAVKGQNYLLQLSHVCSDPLLVTETVSYHAIADQSEIVPFLRQGNEQPYYGASLSLSGVFDLNAGFKDQLPMAEKNLDTLLTEETKDALAQFNAEQGYKIETFHWHEMPWYQRLFTPKPVLQELAQN